MAIAMSIARVRLPFLSVGRGAQRVGWFLNYLVYWFVTHLTILPILLVNPLKKFAFAKQIFQLLKQSPIEEYTKEIASSCLLAMKKVQRY